MIYSNSGLELLFVIFMLSFVFLFESSSTFRYYCKYSFYYAFVMFESVFMIPLFLINAKNVSNLVWAGYVTRPISMFLGIKWELRGKEILSQDKTFVIVANHQSSIDVLGMFQIWHIMNKCTVVAKKELLYAFPFSLAAWLCGLIFIDRKHADKAKASINDAAEYIKSNRIKLWIFPEGTRRNTRKIHEFKKGAFHFALANQLPILPVVISSYSSFLDDQQHRFDQGKVIITTLPPIMTIGLKIDDIEDLMERTRNIMIKTYNETSKEIDAIHNSSKFTKKFRFLPKLTDFTLRPSIRTVDLG
ncbi:1-acyl-sn-glycerol-3-phosphate acyltransferase alpha-like [Culicoides brevitarsis]|uniref:1-acyl-sn-glycerol-3-phosphate acyltransferase alpha-like n=1 Tax=Culicoides brevitarsis TaxID=469753 RepID=UPI00307B7254